MKSLHTLAEVAETLRCNKQNVRRLIQSGELDAVAMGNGTQRRRWLVTDEALQSLIQKRTVSFDACGSLAMAD